MIDAIEMMIEIFAGRRGDGDHQKILQPRRTFGCCCYSRGGCCLVVVRCRARNNNNNTTHTTRADLLEQKDSMAVLHSLESQLLRSL